MTTKKIVILVSGIVIGLGLLIALFIAAIVGTVFYSIANSDAAVVAKAYLKNNETLKGDIGEVKDFGTFITGNINVNNANGQATLYLKAIGERRDANATVSLIYRNGHQWRVTEASYKNAAGETIDLMNPYEPPPESTPEP